MRVVVTGAKPAVCSTRIWRPRLSVALAVVTILSLDDVFTTGVAFDLLGGFLLARGLLADPRDMAHRASTRIGYNSAIVAREVRAQADGEAGLAMLVVGFLLQCVATRH